MGKGALKDKNVNEDPELGKEFSGYSKYSCYSTGCCKSGVGSSRCNTIDLLKILHFGFTSLNVINSNEFPYPSNNIPLSPLSPRIFVQALICLHGLTAWEECVTVG